MAATEPERESPRPPIRLYHPVVSEEAIEAVGAVLRSGWIGSGPRAQEFEAAFADYLGGVECVAVNSGTSAIHLALRCLDLEPGDEIVTPALTFVSANHMILAEGGTPRFADVERLTGNLDPESIERSLSDRTKAILLLHYAGYACDLDRIYALASQAGVEVIEDCAHAVGATYKGRYIGTHGRLHAFSFGPVKNLTTGQGGAVTTPSAALAERLRRMRLHGVSRSTFERSSAGNRNWDYEVTELGFNYDMSDVAGAIGLDQLKRLDRENEVRSRSARRYSDRLSAVRGVTLLERADDRQSNHHLFPILAEDRDQLADKLLAHDVIVGMHYKRNDLYPMYEEHDLPNTEWFAQRVLSLPMHVLLSEDEIDYVCSLIESGW